MAAKITLTGKRIGPITTTNYYRFDMRETGSPTAPKGLPLSSSVLYSVFVGLKPGKKIDILNLPEDQPFLIMGEITMDLPKKICPGKIGVIAFNIQLIEPKEKEPKAPKVPEEVTKLEIKNVLPVEKVDMTNPLFDTDLKNEVHALYKGICTSCSVKMDKRVARVKLIDQKLPPEVNNLLLICPDCYKHRRNPALDSFLIGPNAMLKFEGLGMDQIAINQFLSDFINKFILVEIVDSRNIREYWVPGNKSIVKFKVVKNIISDLLLRKTRLPLVNE